jgi:hypothetical protein
MMEQELGQLIHILNPYSNPTGVANYQQPGMVFPCCSLPPGVLVPQGGGNVLAQFELELDNYTEGWAFRGYMHRLERALRITYRYPILDKMGAPGVGAAQPTGAWASEHLLIGYAGSNGG